MIKVGDKLTLEKFEKGDIIPNGDYIISSVNNDGSFHVGGLTAVWPSRIKKEKHGKTNNT